MLEEESESVDETIKVKIKKGEYNQKIKESSIEKWQEANVDSWLDGKQKLEKSEIVAIEQESLLERVN